MQLFPSDGRLRAVAGVDDGINRQCHEPVQAHHDFLVISPRKVGASNPFAEKRVAAKEDTVPVKADATGTVAGRMHHGECEVAALYGVPVFQ